MLQKNGKVKTFFECFVNLIKKEGVFYFMDQYEKILQQLIDERYSIYAQADITVETHDESLRKTLGQVLRAIEDYSNKQ